MKSVVRLGFALALAGGLPASLLTAEEPVAAKVLPTLLIKGEVVSLDTSNPSENLLKVKDRYGFETPIYVTSETKVSQGDAPKDVSGLSAGTAVEVEYNFDVNTAKRHAVSVKLPAAAASAAASEAPAAPVAPAAPAEPAPAAPSAAAEPAPSTPVQASVPAPAGEAAPSVQ